MQIELTVKPVSHVYLRSDSKGLNPNNETFQDALQRMLNNKSNSRPPKMELTGVLIPLAKENPQGCVFKIETDQNEYLLRMSEFTELIAKKLAWEEVIVKGYINEDDGLFDVEKISLSNNNDPLRPSLGPVDLQYEIEQYKRTINRRGKIDIASEYLVS